MNSGHLSPASSSQPVFHPFSQQGRTSAPASSASDLAADAGFPWDITHLVGRARELTEVTALLREQAVRLLVLTGPGGAGKTRLALHVARNLPDSLFDRIAFVSLSPVRHVDLVEPAIANALDVRPATGETLRDAILRSLQDQRTLLLIDNFEQVIPAASLLADLLSLAGQLKIMVTSRSILGVYGEHNYPVPPLSVPRETRHGAPFSADHLMDIESVQLLVARARAVDPMFSITPDNATAVASICRQLDGLPLAIELAAARLDVFTPAMLNDRLQHSLGILNRGPQNVPDRLRTMRNAIAWSYELLTPTEQTILRRLAIYLGNWTLADAEALLRTPITGDDTFDEIEVIDTLSSLVSKSLIRQVAGYSGGSHFRMLQTLREFNLEQLRDKHELEAVQNAQFAWLLQLAETAFPELTGHRQKEWLNRLEERHADFRAAFAVLLQQDHPEHALRLARALWRFGYIRGHVREMREYLTPALERVPERTSLRAHALNGAGYLANTEGEPQNARILHASALEIGRELQDHHICGDALMGLGGAAVELDDLRTARGLYEDAAVEFQRAGNKRGLAVVSTNLGNLFQATGELASARRAHELAFQRYNELGDIRGIAWSHTNIGHIASETGATRDAIRHFLDAFDRYVDLGDFMGHIEILEALALISANLDDAATGATMLGAAAALRDGIHTPVQTQEQDRYQATIDMVKSRLGEEAFASHWARGEALSNEAICDLAESTAKQWLEHMPEHIEAAEPPQADVSLGLTEREGEVLRLLAAGKSDRDIAGELFISVRTVGTHVSNILGKLDVPSRTAAVAHARQKGVLD